MKGVPEEPLTPSILDHPWTELARTATNLCAAQHNADMDQGIAAAFAGIAGLVGAAIGGLATAYGARIGAHKSLEAVMLQVHQQSRAEHDHWLRDQRRQACVDFIDAFVAFARSVSDCGGYTATSQNIPSEVLDGALRDLQELIIRREHLTLWGPPELVDLARRTTEAATTLRSEVGGWHEIRASRSADRIAEYRERVDAHMDTLGQSRAAFTDAARRVLGRPL